MLAATAIRPVRPAGATGEAVSPYLIELRNRIRGDQGLDETAREEWVKALEAEFAGAFVGLPRDTATVSDRIDTITHVVTEGLFDEMTPAEVAPVARAAFDARTRGAPAAAVEGIALYGLSDYVTEKKIRLSGEQIATWADGADRASRLGVPDYIAQDFVAQAISNGWTLEDYNALNRALMDATHAGYRPERVGRYLLLSMARGEKSVAEIVAGMRPYLENLRRAEGPVRRELGSTSQQPEDSGANRLGATPPQRRANPPAEKSGDRIIQRYPSGWAIVGRERPWQSPVDTTTGQGGATERTARPQSAPVIAQPDQVRGQVPAPVFDRELRSWIGTPYVWGGEQKTFGADCSGFTQGAFGAVSIKLPRVSRDQARVGLRLPPSGTGNLSFGDLVFFDTRGGSRPSRVSHVGVYVGRGRMIHASSKRGIMETDFTRRYYQSKYLLGRRVAGFR